MAKTRQVVGTALVAAGVAVGLFGLRGAVGDRAEAAAGMRVEAVRDPAPALLTEADRAVEAKVRTAAELKPLLAALQANVDGRTLLDLFDNEDWWKPYRDEFPIARVVVGATVLASRGTPELGTQDDSVVKLARKREVGSATVMLGGRPFLLVAARLSVRPETEPVLVLGRPGSVPPPAALAPPRAALASAPPRSVFWVVAGAIALGGLGLLFSGRGKAAPLSGALASPVPVEAPHEPTSKFGTPLRPQPIRPPGAAEMLTPVSRPRSTDGGAMSIGGGATGATAPVVAIGLSPAAPRLFGRYRLVDRLGEGGMSELFIAESAGVEGFTRNFVLKRLRPELARDKDAVAQFIDEARMQASLVHSNIVPVFDFGVVGGEYFMTQEYIVGRDLSRLMARYYESTGAGLPSSIAYYIAHETLQALAYAHDKQDRAGSPMGIVHRDISASNVMVSMLGEVKLSDFGIVKSNRRVSRTQVGTVKGNANFMSPEQARGQEVDPRSDLFSLGHVLFYSLTGDLLYSGANDLDVLYRAATGLTSEDWIRIRQLPDPAAQLLEKAMAADPRERFQSASEFADALAAHMGGGKSGVARLMQQFFGEDIRRETA